ncbi:hypothetical protein ALO43_200564 [Pseudomonas tremae]|uniref:Glycine/betaine ABC transporter ATP-binding protein n=1 Tax=Pseudomonas tremae TaxID=200454 RepID=A0AA40P116_9PSED|nr:hypothetical protein ALO43_200564 [Pseudomonas tremae]
MVFSVVNLRGHRLIGLPIIGHTYQVYITGRISDAMYGRAADQRQLCIGILAFYNLFQFRKSKLARGQKLQGVA